MMTQAINQKEYRRLEKLEALARCGVGGEKETAQRKYEELRRKLDDEAFACLKFDENDSFEDRLTKENINLLLEGCKTCTWGRANNRVCEMCDTTEEVERLKGKLA